MAISPEYRAWLQRCGVKQYGIEAAFVQQGWRGVIATRAIEPGQTILEVPEDMLMTGHSALHDAQLRAALHARPALAPVQVLGIHLLHELAKSQPAVPSSSRACTDVAPCTAGSSRWQLYLQQLPQSYTTFANWSPSEIEALQLPHACATAAAAVQDTRDQWLGALPVLRDLGLPRKFLGLPAWQWAASTLMSRTMFVPFDSAGGLTPFGDLHNYQPPPAPFTPNVLRGLPRQQPQQQPHGQQQQPHGQQQQQRLDSVAAIHAPSYLRLGPEPHGSCGDLPFGCTDATSDLPRSEHAEAFVLGHGRCSCGREEQEGRAAGVCHSSTAVNGRDEQECEGLQEQMGSLMLTDGVWQTMGEGSRDFEQPNEVTATAPVSDRGCLPEGGEHNCAGREPDDRPDGTAFLSARFDGQRGVKGGSAEADGAGASSEGAGTAGTSSTGVGSGSEEENEGEDPQEEGGSGVGAGDGHYDAEAGVYRLVSRQRYNPGDQVFLCYGRHTNLQLLEHYGFLLDDNPHDTAQLPTELVLAQAGGAGPSGHSDASGSLLQAECFVHANGRPSWGLLQALRTMAELPSDRRRCGHLLAAGERVSAAGDLRAMVWLRGACVRHLESMPTSLAEDEALLLSGAGAAERGEAAESAERRQGLTSAAGDAGPRGRGQAAEEAVAVDPKTLLAVQWRACQKRILARAIGVTDCCIERLAPLVAPDEADRILGRGRHQSHRVRGKAAERAQRQLRSLPG